MWKNIFEEVPKPGSTVVAFHPLDGLFLLRVGITEYGREDCLRDLTFQNSSGGEAEHFRGSEFTYWMEVPDFVPFISPNY